MAKGFIETILSFFTSKRVPLPPEKSFCGHDEIMSHRKQFMEEANKKYPASIEDKKIAPQLDHIDDAPTLVQHTEHAEE